MWFILHVRLERLVSDGQDGNKSFYFKFKNDQFNCGTQKSSKTEFADKHISRVDLD